MDDHRLLQLQMQQQNQRQQPVHQQRGQLVLDGPNAAGPSTFASLIQQEIPECRHNLRENHVNLKRLGDYCKANYVQKQDRDLALDETKQFAQQALASVAYQLNAYAFNLTQLFDFQFNQITDIESEVRYLNHLVTIHREKVARREIGVLTTNKVTKRDAKIVPPAQPERVQRYHRQRIDYSIYDDIGHGVRSTGSNLLGKQISTTASSSSGGGYAPGSVALRGQQPQHRDSVSSSGNPSPLPWMPMMQFDDIARQRAAEKMGTLGRNRAGHALGGGEYVGVVQIPQLQMQQQPQRYPNTTVQESNGNYPLVSSTAAAYQRSISNVGDAHQYPRNSMTSDQQSNSVAFLHLVQQHPQYDSSTTNMLPTGRIDYSDATLLPAHRRGAGGNSNTNHYNNSNPPAAFMAPPSSNPYSASVADGGFLSQQQYDQLYKQQQQQIMPPPPLMGGDSGGVVQSHYATQRQVFSHMPPAAFGTLHHQHNSRNHQQQQVAANGGNSHYAPNMPQQMQQTNHYQYDSQQSQDTLVSNDGYSNGSSATATNNSTSSAAGYSVGNASTISVPSSNNMLNNYNNMPNKYAPDNMNQKVSQLPLDSLQSLNNSDPTDQQSRSLQSQYQPNAAELNAAQLAVPRLYLEKVVAIYDYTRQQPDELEFKEGQVIYVLKKNEDSWFEGILDGVRGLFPGNYVETIALGPMSSAPPPPVSAVDAGRYNNGNVTGYGVAANGQSIYR